MVAPFTFLLMLTVVILPAGFALADDAPSPSVSQAGGSLVSAERLIAAGQSAAAVDLLLPLEPQLAGTAEYDYLLGLAALQSGQFTLAISALERVTLVQPRHAGAWLDLVVAHRSTGDLSTARQLLLHVEQTFATEQLQAQRMLALQRSLEGDSLLRGWHGQADVLSGYVANANLGIGVGAFNLTPTGGAVIPVSVDPASRPRGDASLQMRGSAQRLFDHGDGSTTQLNVGGRFRSYADESAFAFGDVAASVSHLRPVAGRDDLAWQMGAYARGLYSQGEMLGVFAAAQGGLRWVAGRCALAATLELERREYTASGQFSASLAWLGGQLDCALNRRHSIGGGVRAASDEPDGARPGGGALRSEASLGWRWAATPQVRAELSLYAAYSRDREGFSALLEGNARRHLMRTGERVTIEWRNPFGLERRFSALLELENVHEDSNLPLFVFSDRQVFVGLRLAF